MLIAAEKGVYCSECGIFLDNSHDPESDPEHISACWAPSTAICDKCDIRALRKKLNETKKYVPPSFEKVLSERRKQDTQE